MSKEYQSATSNGSAIQLHDNFALSAGDVKVGISLENAQSLITQVDRNNVTVGNTNSNIDTNKLKATTAADVLNTNTNMEVPNRSRSLIEWLFCCGPRNTLHGHSGPNCGQISLIVSSNSEKKFARNNSSTSSLRSLPARIPDMDNENRRLNGKKCLALDLDETLVHSSFQPVDNASFVISVVIEGIVHNVYVMKRPGCDEFMKRLAEHYEILIYTASLSKYADPLLDILDPNNLVSKRLFREHCVFYDGHYVKDLSLLNRDISQTIIVDNSPMSYIFHPENAIDCSSFFDDPTDVELWQIADFLINIRFSEDVRPFCRHWREWCRNNPTSVPTDANSQNKK